MHPSSESPNLTDGVMPRPETLLESLAGPSRLGQRPGLERIRALLAEMGNPERELRIVHVGGTSGKGSTATIAARIFQEAGYRVGLHVKPHLEQVEERFVVDGEIIPPDRLVGLIRDFEAAIRRCQPSWYELTVALALEYFRQEQVDIAVVEVGLGGTYDATNVVQPRVVILTNVGLDHTEILGDTVEKIAADKVGIVKPGRPVVCGASQASVQAIVAERCREIGAPLWQLGREILVSIHDVGLTGSRFDLTVPGRRLTGLNLAPLGAHQIDNAALATSAALALEADGVLVDEAAIRRALAKVAVPGRLETARESPLVLLDGAHNPAKMEALTRALDLLYPERSAIGVLAFKRGHDVAATLRMITPRLRLAILTQFDAATDYGRGQSLDPSEVDGLFEGIPDAPPRSLEPNPIRAVQLALGAATDRDLVCVTGSLYLVGVVRAWLRSSR